MAEGERKQRLFFALWPDEALRARLETLVAMMAPLARGRAVTAGNLHITLSFLGFITPVRRACLEALADEVLCRPFELTLDVTGYWPRAQVAWLGTTHVPAELANLAVQLNDGLHRCGLEAEKRPYRPHLTLLRKVKPAGMRVLAQAGLTIPPLTWPIGGFALVESRLRRQGAVYEVLRTWACMSGKVSNE